MQISSIVDVENLTVQFGDKIAVDNISVSVDKGEVLGVLGPNGAGKTCMLRAMLGLLPYRGRISLFGIDSEHQKQILPLVGYVPQKIDFEPLFPATVHDVVAMGVIPQKNRRRVLNMLKQNRLVWKHAVEPRTEREAIDKALETVGISHMNNRRIGELSGGQRQRVFIAQSLVREPLLIIMDEPVNGMDIESQSLVYSAIKQASREYHTTIIISLHDLDMLREYTSTMMCLNCSLMYHGETGAFFADRNHVRMYTESSLQCGRYYHGV